MSERDLSQYSSGDEDNRELNYSIEEAAQYSVNNSTYMVLDDGKPLRTEKFVLIFQFKCFLLTYYCFQKKKQVCFLN